MRVRRSSPPSEPGPYRLAELTFRVGVPSFFIEQLPHALGVKLWEPMYIQPVARLSSFCLSLTGDFGGGGVSSSSVSDPDDPPAEGLDGLSGWIGEDEGKADEEDSKMATSIYRSIEQSEVLRSKSALETVGELPSDSLVADLDVHEHRSSLRGSIVEHMTRLLGPLLFVAEERASTVATVPGGVDRRERG